MTLLGIFLNNLMFLISLTSLHLIKLFHNTAAEYLSDLIPKLVVFI